MLGNGRMFISHHHPGEVSASFVISPYIWILWSTSLWAAYIRHRVMGEHDHVVTDSKPSINTSQACQLDQTDSLSARVNQILVGASREHRALHSTWSWLLKFTLWWGWSWSKGFVWVQEAEPLQKSVCCSQDAIYCNRSCFKTWKSVTFSWDQERALLIFFRVWNSSTILSLPCCLTSSNPNALQKWQFCARWNHLKLTGTKKAAYYWQKPFRHLAVWVHIPENL